MYIGAWQEYKLSNSIVRKKNDINYKVDTTNVALLQRTLLEKLGDEKSANIAMEVFENITGTSKFEKSPNHLPPIRVSHKLKIPDSSETVRTTISEPILLNSQLPSAFNRLARSNTGSVHVPIRKPAVTSSPTKLASIERQYEGAKTLRPQYDNFAELNLPLLKQSAAAADRVVRGGDFGTSGSQHVSSGGTKAAVVPEAAPGNIKRAQPQPKTSAYNTGEMVALMKLDRAEKQRLHPSYSKFWDWTRSGRHMVIEGGAKDNRNTEKDKKGGKIDRNVMRVKKMQHLYAQGLTADVIIDNVHSDRYQEKVSPTLNLNSSLRQGASAAFSDVEATDEEPRNCDLDVSHSELQLVSRYFETAGGPISSPAVPELLKAPFEYPPFIEAMQRRGSKGNAACAKSDSTINSLASPTTIIGSEALGHIVHDASPITVYPSSVVSPGDNPLGGNSRAGGAGRGSDGGIVVQQDDYQSLLQWSLQLDVANV